MAAITLRLEPLIQLTSEQFFQLCRANPDLRMERTAGGELIVMPPTGWGTGHRNIKLTTQLQNWAEQNGTGLAFDSSTGFHLPNGADRSPDAAWVKRERIAAISPDPDQFLPLCPDFVVELRSASDSLISLQNKLQEYMDNGALLGWLIDPQNQQVEIYRQNQSKEVRQNPTCLSGENVLPGFVIDLQQILNLTHS